MFRPLTCAAIVLASLAMGACASTKPRVDYGMQESLAGFVPARTAILPCQLWPAGAQYPDQPLSSAKEAELSAFCEKFDAYILEGFRDQPFMKGYSPKAILKSLSDNQLAHWPEQIPKLWDRPPQRCEPCVSPPSTYVHAIKDRPQWLAWLTTLSAKAKNADAVLLPFVTHAYEKRYQDRGLFVAERGLGVSMLLIETSSGALIWAGGRSTAVPQKILSDAGTPATPEFPPWNVVAERVFMGELWRDYPGRQNR